MKLPAGRRVAESEASVADLLQQYGQNFKGSINVHQAGQGVGSNGFIIVDNGRVLAAAYSLLSITLYQFSALDRMMSLATVRSEIIALTDDEIRGVLNEYPQAALTESSAGDGAEPASADSASADSASAVSADATGDKAETQAPAQQAPAAEAPGREAEAGAEEPELASPAGYKRLLSAFTALPGVVGSALVAEGFPVYQLGTDVDFEHVAAATEDMVRAGTRIATELQLGATGQIILETPEYKVIIAPINDMFLCVLTRSDTNLGLIRLNIRNAQRSQED